MTDPGWNRVPIEPQRVNAPLSAFAIFLVVSIAPGDEAAATAKAVVADIGGLVRTVGFRDVGAHLSCIVGIGAGAWARFGQTATPKELHPFAEIRGSVHTAVSTPGDLLGFVDGTENPTGLALTQSTLIAEEDPAFRGCSYVVVQKYLHDLAAWARLSTAEQEQVIGRTKADNVELAQEAGGRKSHKALTTIVDAEGVEHDILRDNMPFGRPGQGEFGTYFIGYARALWVIEQMLTNMFVGDPPGTYDRILDVSTATTGTTFFVPSNELLSSLDDG